MTTPTRGMLLTLTYATLKLTPLGVAFVILDLSRVPQESMHETLDLLVRLVVVMIAWCITEGSLMLWIQEKKINSSTARGYGIVSLVLSLITLFALQLFRLQASRGIFILLLLSLTARGMARSGWEHGRPLMAFWLSPIAHTTLGALSFLITPVGLPLEAAVISFALGTILSSLDATWYGDSLNERNKRWIAAAYRGMLVIGPILVGFMALMVYLPRMYAAFLLLPLLAQRITRHTMTSATIPTERLGAVTGICILFVVMLLACFILDLIGGSFSL